MNSKHMEIEIRESSQYKTTDWSGGRTTELYIFPENGDYARREFLIRISSATVEPGESRFTKLSGFRRELMLLEGGLELVHEGRSRREMRPYDVDSFLGSWDTVSFGTSPVRDFNLMAKEGMETSMIFEQVETVKEFSWSEERFAALRETENGKHGREHKIAVYVIEGKGKAGDYEVETSQLIVLNHYLGEIIRFENTGEAAMKLAVCQILV